MPGYTLGKLDRPNFSDHLLGFMSLDGRHPLHLSPQEFVWLHLTKRRFLWKSEDGWARAENCKGLPHTILGPMIGMSLDRHGRECEGERCLRRQLRRRKIIDVDPHGAILVLDLTHDQLRAWLPAIPGKTAPKPRPADVTMRAKGGRIFMAGADAPIGAAVEAQLINSRTGEIVATAQEPLTMRARKIDSAVALRAKPESEQHESVQKVMDGGLENQPYLNGNARASSDAQSVTGVRAAEKHSVPLPEWMPREEWCEWMDGRRKHLHGSYPPKYVQRRAIRQLEALRDKGCDLKEEMAANIARGCMPDFRQLTKGGANGAGQSHRRPSGAIPPPAGKQYPQPHKIAV